MNLDHFILGRPLVKAMLCVAALALSACASDPGEKVVDEPFPDLAEVPSRPEAGTTAEERRRLRAQLERRRDEINAVAASLLRGGTEAVPVALESQVPEAPDSRHSQVAPPPLPAGLPEPPGRPESLSDAAAPVKPEPPSAEKITAEESDDGMIDAPEEAQMPPARAAGEKGETDPGTEDEGEDG